MQVVLPRSSTGSTRRPLFHHNAQVVEPLDDCLDVAANFGAVFARSQRRLRHRDHAAVMPGASRQRNQGRGQVAGTQLQFLAPGRIGTQQRSLPHGAGIRILHGHAEGEVFGVDGNERIEPCAGLVNIHIHALCGQGDTGQLSPLAIDFCGCGLGLVLRVYGALGHVGYGLLFLVAGNKRDRKQQGKAQKSADLKGLLHPSRITAAQEQGAALPRLLPFPPAGCTFIRMAIASLFLEPGRNRLKAAFVLLTMVLAAPAAMSSPLLPFKRPPKDIVTITLVETASYIPCRDGCSAATQPVRAFCFRLGDEFLVADGESYFHENKFEDMEDLAGKQIPLRLGGRWVWLRPADRPSVKLRRGSLYEDFKDSGCIREVHRPIIALAAHSRPHGKVPAGAIAIAGPGRGEFQPLYLWYQCGLDGDAIACQRWYRNGKPTAGDWYCAQATNGTQAEASFAIDPLLSRTGRLVLASGAVLGPDLRERLDGKLEKPDHACF